MTTYTFDAESGTNGTTISTSNSIFDQVNVVSGTKTFDTAAKIHGNLGIHVTQPTTTNSAFFQHTASGASASFAIRAYFKLISMPSINAQMFFKFRNSVSGALGQINFNTTGTIQVTAGSTNGNVSTGTLTTGTVYRVEAVGTGFGTSSSAVTVHVYSGDTNTIVATSTVSGGTTGAQVDRIWLGMPVTGTTIEYYFDDVVLNYGGTTEIGPVVTNVILTFTDDSGTTDGGFQPTTQLFIDDVSGNADTSQVTGFSPGGGGGSGVTIVATEQNSWPLRMLITITNLTVGNNVTIYRQVDGARTALRGFNGITAIDTSVVAVDGELPYGVPVSYVASVNGTTYITPEVTHVLVNADFVISDAIGGGAVAVEVVKWPDRQRQKPGTVFQVNGKNIGVFRARGQWAGEAQFYTATQVDEANFNALLDSATFGILLFRCAVGSLKMDYYFIFQSDTEEMWGEQDSTDPSRVWSIQMSESDPWDQSFEALGFTLQDLADRYPGTLQDINNAFPTLLSIAQGDLS